MMIYDSGLLFWATLYMCDVVLSLLIKPRIANDTGCVAKVAPACQLDSPLYTWSGCAEVRRQPGRNSNGEVYPISFAHCSSAVVFPVRPKLRSFSVGHVRRVTPLVRQQAVHQPRNPSTLSILSSSDVSTGERERKKTRAPLPLHLGRFSPIASYVTSPRGVWFSTYVFSESCYGETHCSIFFTTAKYCVASLHLSICTLVTGSPQPDR